jgi:IS30 family transposase
LSQGNPLCVRERESILRGLAQNESLRLIAERIGRSPSTVSREVARNGGKDDGILTIPIKATRASLYQR